MTRRCCSTMCSAPNFAWSPAIPARAKSCVAIERNEVQGVCGMGWDAMYSQRPDWLEKGFIRVLVQENLSGSPMFDTMGVPKSIDFAKTPEDRAGDRTRL